MFRLDEFFRANRDIELPNGEIVTQRVLSDFEMNAKRDYALSEATRVSDALKNPESDLYKTKILPLEDTALETLIDLMAQGRMYELEREARDLYRLDFVPTPDEATLIEEIDTGKKQTEIELKVYADRAKHVLGGINAYRQKVSELPRETLLKELHTRAIQSFTYAMSQDSDVYYTVWCSIESDGKKHWKTVDDIHQMPMPVIDRLYKLYKEMDSIDPWEITKSESAGVAGGVDKDATGSTESPTG